MIRRLVRRLARAEIARSVEAACTFLVSRIDDPEQQIAALERSQRELLRIASVRTAERDRARGFARANVSATKPGNRAALEAALADEPGELSA